ncbi:MAG: hypothetical protein M5U07_08410 [Xanthobacteraceae bacterium]|nr:hypothetical protein [Xanthobacteraceae bacterium]
MVDVDRVMAERMALPEQGGAIRRWSMVDGSGRLAGPGPRTQAGTAPPGTA